MTPQLRSGTLRMVLRGLAACALGFSGFSLVGEASPLQQTAPLLGAASSFAVLGGSTVTNTGTSIIRGDLGVSPGTAVTGFPPGLVSGGTHSADAPAGQAQVDTTTAYNALVAQPCTVDLTSQNLGGMTLTPGVYCFSSSAGLTGPSALTLNAAGNGAAVFVFKIGSMLTTASGSSVSLINGASSCNVFWQVGSSATLGTTTNFVGTIIALTSISLTTGAIVSGRALARNGAVTLDTNNVGPTPCVIGPTVTPATATAAAATATAVAAATATAAAATAIAALPPQPFQPLHPAATVTPPTPTPTLTSASATAISAAATATANSISGATATVISAATTATAVSAATTATAVSAATTATAVSAATTATAVTVAAGVAAAAPATPTATPASAANATAPNAVTAPAPEVPAPAPIPIAMPAPQVPTALPRTGGGVPPVGLFSLLLGGLAVALAMTVRRTRK